MSREKSYFCGFSENIMNINERFAHIRISTGLKKKQFADSLAINQSVAGDIELGKREPSREVMLKLASVYKVNLNWLLTGEGDMFIVSDRKSISDPPVKKEEKPPLVKDMEALITENIGGRMEALETRLATVESSLKRLASLTPEMEYPAEDGRGGYTAEPEPEYGDPAGPVAFRDQIAAGPPIDQLDDESMVVDVPLRYIKTNLSDYYALRIRGNSMIDALIPDGSLVLIRKSDAPVDGAIQVVSVDGQATLKRLREGEDHRWTICYEDGSGRTVAMGEGLRIQGDFVAVLPPSTRLRMRGGE
jgi:SOS-response transcriptional repressor LexA/DNA-binding XRE family transcriptional regulator